eukprot:403342382
MKSRNYLNESSTIQSTQEKLQNKSSYSLNRTSLELSSSAKKEDRYSIKENLTKQISDGLQNLNAKSSSNSIQNQDFVLSDINFFENQSHLNSSKKKMIIQQEKIRIKKLSRNTQQNFIYPKTQMNSSTQLRKKIFTSMNVNSSEKNQEKPPDLKLQKAVASTKEIVNPVKDLRESRRMSMLRKNLTLANINGDGENSYSPQRISVDHLIDQSIANKKGVIPKLFQNFKKQMDNEKNKKKVEIQDDYIRLKIKMLQKAKKLNLMSTNDKDNNLLIPCKIKPRKAEVKIINPHLSNIRYAVILNNSPLMQTNSMLKREIFNFNHSTEIRPSPQVLHSFKIPKTEAVDIQNNITLIRTNPKKYANKVPIPFSNHHLPPKPYIKQHRNQNNGMMTRRQFQDNPDRSNNQSPLSNRSRSQNQTPLTNRSNKSITGGAHRSARSLNLSQRSNVSMSSFRIKQLKNMQKVYLNKSIREFRKQLEGILTDQKRKMQDIEMQNSYFKELANVSSQVNKIMTSENIYMAKKKMTRSFTKKEVSNLQNYKTLINQQEEQEKSRIKENIREKLCQCREQRFALQELLYYLKKLKKQMKRDKTFKQKFSKEKDNFHEIDESIELADILKKKIKEVQKQLFNESQRLLDSGIELCKDEVLNPLKFQNSFYNKETEEFVKLIFEDENSFLKKIRISMLKYNRTPTLEKKLKKSILGKTEMEKIRKQQEDAERKRAEMGNNMIFKAFTKKVVDLRTKLGPVCIKPSSLDLNVHIENFKLDSNYFEPVNPSLAHLQSQFSLISMSRSRQSISLMKFNTLPC